MTWRTRLLPASFRGVPFKVPNSGRSGGRRVALHEYPLRDLPYAEDLGRRARTWQVEAILLGPTYDLTLKALVAALEAPGAGLLTHPEYGLLRVMVERFRVSLSTEEGGLARVQIDAVEAGSNAMPGALADTLGAGGRAVATVLGRVAEVLAPVWQVAGQVSRLHDLAVGWLGTLLGVYELLGGRVGMVGAARAGQVQSLAVARAQLASLAGSGALVGAEVVRQSEALRTLAGAPWAGYQALVELWTWGETLPAAPPTTPTRLLEAANLAGLIGAVRDAAVAAASLAALSALARADDGPLVARLAVGVPSTRDEITALRNTLLAAIDARAAVAADAGYEAWQVLRAAVAVDLSERVLVAPRRRVVVPSETRPALVLAYGLYGDAGRAEEIVRRNKIRHPGFVPGGVEIEVVE